MDFLIHGSPESRTTEPSIRPLPGTRSNAPIPVRIRMFSSLYMSAYRRKSFAPPLFAGGGRAAVVGTNTGSDAAPSAAGFDAGRNAHGARIYIFPRISFFGRGARAPIRTAR